MSNESITITQSINSAAVAAGGSVGLNAGGLIQGNLEVDGNVVIDGLLTVGADTDGKDVRFWGETASKYVLWDASQDKLIITGDLQVDGTTTTINSTVVTIEDPVFTLGGATAPTTSDSKDRGIEFHYYDTDASAGKKGFFGWGNSDNAIKFLLNCADPSGSEIFTGDLAEVHTGDLFAGDGTSNLNFIVGRSSAGQTSGFKLLRGLGDFSSNSHNNFGLIVTDYGLAVSKFTDPGANATGRADYLTIADGGNVGIGTSSPSEALEVDGNIRLSFGGRIDAGGGGLGFASLSNYSSPLTITGTPIKFEYYDGAAYSEGFRLDSSGNVGIGTTAPAARLDLTTSLSSGATLDLFKSALTSYPSNTNIKGAYIELTDDANAGGCAVFGVDVDITHAKNHGSNRIYGVHSVLDGTGSNNQYAGYFESDAAINYLGDHGQSATLLVNGKGTGHLFRVEDSDTAVFTIVDGGNVGIGVAAPSAKLDLAGSDNTLAKFTRDSGEGAIKVQGSDGGHYAYLGSGTARSVLNSSNELAFSTGGTEVVRINAYSQVGIGTDSPGGTLQLHSALTRQLLFTNPTEGSAGSQGTYMGTGVNTKHFRLVNQEAGNITLGTNNTHCFEIDDDGNVGIGPVDSFAPSARLHLATAGGAAQLRLENTDAQSWDFYSFNDDNLYINDAGGTRLAITDDGEVGINKASPAELLHVYGETAAKILVEGDASGAVDSVGLRVKARGAYDWFTGIGSTATGASGSSYVIANGTDANTNIRLLLDTSGRIGIGTLSPEATLMISGADDKDTGPNIALRGDSANQVESGRIRLQESASYQGGYVHYNGDTNKLNIGVHDASDSVISSDRNVLTIDRTTGTVEMDRGTTELPFFDYKATTASDADSSISTLTTSGATTHHIQVDINGTKAWIAVSTNNPS